MRSMISAVCLVVLSIALGMAQGARPEPAAPAFEVVSIRPREANLDRSFYGTRPNGGLAYTNVSLRSVIVRAYGLDLLTERFTLVGGPGKLLDARFDILAVPPTESATADGAHGNRSQAMLRTLLASRFRLRVHTATRPGPVYALTRPGNGRLGPSIRSSTRDCEVIRARLRKDPSAEDLRDSAGNPLCAISFDFKPGSVTLKDAGPLAYLVGHLQPWVDRPLVDMTGMTGYFEWTITFARNPLDAELPSVFEAVKDQLGLRLQARTAPTDVLVIDSVEMPAPD